MEELLTSMLDSGEQVLWTGKAEAYETLDATYKKPFIRKAVIAALVFAALLTGYLIAVKGQGVQPIIILVVLLLSAISPLNVLSDGKRLRQTLYAATDRRLLVVRDTAKSVEYEKIAQAEFRQDEAGHTSLLCGGKGLKAKTSNWRLYTLTGPYYADEEETRCERFVLYAVDDVEGLRRVLKEKIPSAM